MIVNLNSNNIQKEIENGLKLVVFSAKWCSYCQRQKEVFRELPDIWVGEVDGDKNPNLVSQYGVMGFPTFILFKNGKEISKFSGYKNKFELMNILTQFI